jgi:Pvc16 N-terminal domain
MIHTVLEVLTKELNQFLKQRTRMTPNETAVVLSALMDNADGAFAVETENQVICTLFNIEQERSNLNAPTRSNAVVNPPFNLNLYVLFAAYYKKDRYIEALKAISYTIAFFQGKQVFTSANTPSLPANIEKVVVEMVNIEMKDISNFWTTLGAKHLPSIMIKVRMLSITSDLVMEETTPILSVDTTAAIK